MERGRGIKIWWFERIFLVGGGGGGVGGGGMSKFSAGGRGLPPSPPHPHPPQKGKPIVVLCGVVFRLCWNVF